jgi:hypothetical protein
MALQISLEHSTGAVFESAYVRISGVEYCSPVTSDKSRYYPDYAGASIRISYEIYVDVVARQAGKKPVESRSFVVSSKNPGESKALSDNLVFSEYFTITNLDKCNPIKAAYGYLKTLTLFKEAKDV